MPNGTYEVTTWAGDLIAGNGTNFDIEGTAFAGPRTSTGVVHEQYFPAITVSDGQLNVRVTGGDGRVNGLRVQTPLAAPAGLEASDIDAVNETITLGWQPVADATGYVLYRSAPGGELEALEPAITDAATTTFTDTTVALGETYEYAVATVKGERVSRPSERVEASVIDPDVTKPATPTGIETAAIDRTTVTLSWDDPGDTVLWKVLRSTRADIPFEEVGTTTEPTFTDSGILTTRPYLYQLVALNAGGTSEASATYATAVATTLVRQAEYLDRAPVAVQTADGVYVGWRQLGLDARDLAYDVYRDGEKITDEPITGATNLVDADGTTDSTYLITAHVGDREVTVADEFGVWSEQFLDVPLDKPADGVTPAGQAYTYAPGDASVGDLDGDGEYELVFQWYPSNSKDNSQSGYTGNVYLDAIELDGTKLWRMDLGRNIRAGAHYTQFQVWDLDGDGKAEVSFKTADGTVDGTGAVIGDASADYRNSSGYILTGPEYLTVFDGQTGAAIDTVDYAPGRGNVGSWGDTYGNRVDRFLAATAYLDGEHPSLIICARLLHAHGDRGVGLPRRRARAALDVRLGRPAPTARRTRGRATTTSPRPTSTATDSTRSCSARSRSTTTARRSTTRGSATATRCTSPTTSSTARASRCSRCTNRRPATAASSRRCATPRPARCSGRTRATATPVVAWHPTSIRRIRAPRRGTSAATPRGTRPSDR